MWVFKSLSALLFLIGWTALVVAAVGTWFYITVYAIMSLGWFAGLIIAVGSVLHKGKSFSCFMVYFFF